MDAVRIELHHRDGTFAGVIAIFADACVHIRTRPATANAVGHKSNIKLREQCASQSTARQ